jgi:Cyclic nucleotide-binding domain/Peptidase C39 family
METSLLSIADFLETVVGFKALSAAQREAIAAQMQPLRYPLGRTVLIHHTLPTHLYLIYSGQVRLIGYDPRTESPATLRLLEPGETVGSLGLIRQHPCETVIASTDTICLTLGADRFLNLLATQDAFAQAYQDEAALVEVFEVLGLQLQRQADGGTNLKQLSLKAWPQSVAKTLPTGHFALSQLDSKYQWFVSAGTSSPFERGSCLPSGVAEPTLKISSSSPTRLVGIPPTVFSGETQVEETSLQTIQWNDIPEAPEEPPTPVERSSKKLKYPFVSGRGAVDAPLACFQMLAKHLNLPFKRDVLRRIVVNQVERQDTLSLPVCGAVAELMGLRAHLAEPPAESLAKLPTPALILWEGRVVVLYEATPQQVVLAIPEHGLVRKKTQQFLDNWEPGPVLLLEKTEHTPQKRFGLSWFWPSIKKHKVVLIEVLIASLMVQLLSLANPLITQIIIDKVLVQNSVATLHLLGILLIGLAVFESLLSSFRT